MSAFAPLTRRPVATATTPQKVPGLDAGRSASATSSKPSRPRRLRLAAWANASSGISTQLKVGAIDDPIERDADRIADAALRGHAVDPTATVEGVTPVRTSGDLGSSPLRRKAVSDMFKPHSAAAPQCLHVELRGARAEGGHPLAPKLLADLEPRFAADLSQVRIHEGPRASALAQLLSARAFTLQNDVFFAHGEFHPSKLSGRKLLAHELAHVVQQGPPDRVLRSPRAEAGPQPNLREYTGQEQMNDIPNMLRAAVAVLGKALAALETKAGRTNAAIAYYLGSLDDARLQRLKVILHGAQESLARLLDDPSGYDIEDVGYLTYYPSLKRKPGRFTFTDSLNRLARGEEPIGLPAAQAHKLIHEALHEFLDLDGKGQSDFSNAHGIVPLLPALGIDPLANAESVASVAVALAMNNFTAVRAASEGNLTVEGELSSSERQLALAVFQYSSLVCHLRVPEQLSSAPPWLIIVLRDGVMKKWLIPPPDVGSRDKLAEGFTQPDLEYLYSKLHVALDATHRELAEHTTKLVTRTSGNAKELGPGEFELRGPLLQSIRESAKKLDAPAKRLDRADILHPTELLIGGALLRNYYKSRRILNMDSPTKFWHAVARGMLVGLLHNTHTEIPLRPVTAGGQ